MFFEFFFLLLLIGIIKHFAYKKTATFLILTKPLLLNYGKSNVRVHQDNTQ